MITKNPDSLTAALLTPVGRDGALASASLRRGGLESVVCRDFEHLLAVIRDGVGTAVLTEETLTPGHVGTLGALMREQPPWSDLPLIVFSSRPDMPRVPVPKSLQELGNVSFVDRPVQHRTLIGAVRSALRARSRQYEARRAIEARDKFLAMLGHELRNPLGAMLFATDLLSRQSVEDPALARYVANIDRQTRHLNRLVDDLLDVARVTSGKVTLKREPVELGALVHRCVDVRLSLADAQGLSLGFEPAPGPLIVDGDVVRLEQIVFNLVGNALKYTPRGGRVVVEVGEHEGRAMIHVADSGVGIAAEHLESIFELFAQGPTSLDRARGGLGIGLTLVRALVSLMGGTVQAQSAGTDRGSDFRVTLPLAAVGASEVPPSAAATTPVPVPVAASVTGENIRVLVVEDNGDIREVLAEVLDVLGYMVDVAADGPEGLSRLLAEQPAVALVDIGLPGFDGYELARRARQSCGPSVLMVAMTGYGQVEDRARALEAGFDEHVTKPVTVEALKAIFARRRNASLAPAAAATSS